MRRWLSSSAEPSSVDSTYAFMKPAKVTVEPVDTKPQGGWPLSAVGRASICTVTRCSLASAIWEAMVRIQISSYRRNSSPRSPVWAGVRKFSPAGRIASCASWAFFTLEV